MSDILSGFSQNVTRMNPLTQFGQGINQIAQNRQAQQQALLQQQALEQAQQQQAELQAQQALQAQQMNEAYQVIQSGNATAQDYANLAMMLPKDASTALRESFSLLSDDEQRTALNQTGQIFSSFKAGRPDVAINLMDQLATSYENSGDPEGAQLMKQWSEIAKSGEEGARQAESYFGFTMAQIPGGTDVIDSAINLSQEKRDQAMLAGELKQQALDAGLTEKQTDKVIADTRKLNVGITQALLELEAYKASGGKDEKTIFDQEAKIRGEWNKQKAPYTEAQRIYDNMISSSTSDSGAGDVALITGFMKMLDPGSVVRESEFALAEGSGGLFNKLQTLLPKIEKGEKLTPSQRKTFTALAKKYMDSTLKSRDKAEANTRLMIKNYGLNGENILGTENAEKTQSVTSSGGFSAAPTNQRENPQLQIYGGL